MSQQTMRQQARRDARTVTSTRRAELLERAKRLEDLAVLVMTAIGERDAAVVAAEQRAGSALRQMTTVEGATLREAVEWCGGRVGIREATRLRRQAEAEQEVSATRTAAAGLTATANAKAATSMTAAG